MNYRHAFHAGNFADIAKHLALLAVLLHLRRKEAAFAVIDTHAGRGAYDLASAQARRTGEAEAGIARIRSLRGLSALLDAYLDLVAGPVYPGSPLIAARLLRPQDRLVAVEKHPGEHEALTALLEPYRNARTEQGDGYKRLAALLPPPERRGAILIDPPYEAPDEFAQAAEAFAAGFRRFATGTYLIWFPVKSAAAANAFCGEVLAAGAQKAVRLDIALRDRDEARLSAAGLLVVNPPYLFVDSMRKALDPVLPAIAADASFDWLAGEG
ncbi:MAG: 23S rRNA (adenine(2030)-N(6))-methyltransferase RlmJ [Alphaproteobacteria bacterium]|nr:23S rRNA (adenine(2030)-N(6))-methyltransferase RlmJ [Alphaproteobacteria bacterium]